MAALRRGVLYVPPLIHCRHRGKINIQRPRPGIHQRRVFEAITQPVLPELVIEDPSRKCPRVPRLLEQQSKQVSEELHPFEKILIRECTEWFENSRLILAFYALPLQPRTKRPIFNQLFNKGVTIQYISNDIIRKSLEGSKWENLLQIVQGYMAYGFAKDCNLPDVLKEVKKIPTLHIMSAVLDDRILTLEGLQRAANLPPIDVLLGQTCSLLGSHASTTKRLLSSHQQALSANLQQYIKDQTGEGTS